MPAGLQNVISILWEMTQYFFFDSSSLSDPFEVVTQMAKWSKLFEKWYLTAKFKKLRKGFSAFRFYSPAEERPKADTYDIIEHGLCNLS